MPGVEVQQKISRMVATLNLPQACRPVFQSNLHVTLVFIGRFPVSRREALIERLRLVRGMPFELMFEGLRFYQRQQMLWLEARSSSILEGLVARLKNVAAEFGVRPDDRVFRPHMTLARKLETVSATLDGMIPLVAPVTHFSLVRSKTMSEGVEYTVLEDFRLQA